MSNYTSDVSGVTPNAGLPQWSGTNKPMMKDFNEAFANIDAKLANMEAELGKRMIGNWSILYPLEAIGIANGTETIESIHNALPSTTTLYFYVGEDSNQSIFPGGFGTVEVIKISDFRTMWRFYNTGFTNLKCWVAFSYKNETSISWSGWREISLLA